MLDVFRGKHRILVTGGTGVGKSQLRQSLGDLNAEAIHASQRTSFPVTERIRVSKQLFDFVDLPGQRLHRSQREDEFKRALARGVAGVLNVVSCGYHEYEVGRVDALQGTDGLSPDFPGSASDDGDRGA